MGFIVSLLVVLFSLSLEEMDVLGAEKFGSHRDVLKKQTVSPIEQVEEHQVFIRVAYSELNPVDLQKLRGSPKQADQPVPSPPFVPGYGGSGIVEAVGEKAPSILKGKRVAFLADPSRRGSYATHIAVDHRLVAEIPSEKLSLRDAASVPLAGCTAYESLVKLGLQESADISDQALLVIGGGGGVGTWAISLARAWHPKLKIVATASSEQSKAWCLQRGADQVVGHDDFVEKLGGGRQGSVSHILCLTEPTPAIFGGMAEVIQSYGTICLVVAGASIQNIDLGFCFFKAANVVLETVFSSIRTNYKSIVPSSEIASILNLLATEAIKAPLSPQLEGLAESWDNALAEGGLLDALASGHVCGKLVMQIGNQGV